MDNLEIANIVTRYAKIVNDTLGCKKVVLFGSYAKGNNTKDSDIDIAVVFSDYEKTIDMQLALMRLTRKVDSRIEPHPFREADYNLSNPIASEIIKYGKDFSSAPL